MSNIFHKDEIFEDARAAWNEYRRNPGRFAFPERITAELTNHCNLNCRICPRQKVEMAQGYMGMPLFKKIIDEAAQFLPICLVPFFRGEALLHPDFLEMLSYAKRKGMKPIQISSNATLLTESLVKGILDLEIDVISFSIHIDETPKERYRNLLLFLEEKRKQDKALPNIQVSCVKTEDNTDRIDGFVNFWLDKADRVRVYDAHSLDGRLGHIEDDDDMARRPCLKLLTDIAIYWNGDVAVCNHDWQRDRHIGNLSMDSIGSIWKSAAYSRLRECHLAGDCKDLMPCGDCSHWKAYYKKRPVIGKVYEKKVCAV